MLISIALKLAYRVTKNHPLLWFFGLFLVGGFNILLFKLVGIPDLFHLNAIPTFSNLQILMAIFTIIILLVIGNVARIALIVFTLTKCKRELEILLPEFKTILPEIDFNHMVESHGKLFALILKRSLLPTVATSILANLFLFLAMVVVFAPQVLFFITKSHSQSSMVFLFLFLPLALIGLYINMVTPLFIIVLKNNFSASIRLAYDLLVKSFSTIIFTISSLGVIYFGVSFLGLLITGQIAIVFGYQFSTALLIFILAIMNAFCHVTLLIMFLFIVRPTKSLEATKSILTQPALGHDRY